MFNVPGEAHLALRMANRRRTAAIEKLRLCEEGIKDVLKNLEDPYIYKDDYLVYVVGNLVEIEKRLKDITNHVKQSISLVERNAAYVRTKTLSGTDKETIIEGFFVDWRSLKTQKLSES